MPLISRSLWRLLSTAVVVALPIHPAVAQDAVPNTGATNNAAADSRASSGAAVGTAPEGSASIAEIVVTAQKRSENLQNVPIAVTAISGASLAAKGITNTADLIAVTPGLNYTTNGGFALPRIRGVGTGSSTGGNENPVATYIDGVYIASASSSMLSLNNIEQVAVLKGPQGTLFGRNATGGLIQITTRTPQQHFSGEASATYGNDNRFGGDVYLTGGLAPNVAVDLAAHYMNQEDGYGTNLFNGKDVNKARDLAVRSKLRAELGAATTATLALDYADSHAAEVAFRPITGSIPVTGVPFTGGKFDIDTNVEPMIHVKQGGVSLTLDHDLGFAKLVSITAYRRSQYSGSLENDKLPQLLSQIHFEEPDRQFSQELQLVSRAGSSFDWVVGGYYFSARSAFDPATVTLGNGTSPTAYSTIESAQRARSGAVFGQATVHLTDTTNLTGGLRYTEETRHYQVQPSFQPVGGTVTPGALVTGRIHESKLTWRLALDQHLGDNVLGYVSYNRGFKSGGFNPQRTTNPLLPFSPEVLDAYEVGLKTNLFDHKVRINTAGFYYNYKNIQIIAYNAGFSTISNAASAKIYGLDLDAAVAPTRALTLNLGLSLVHDRFGDFPAATISTPLVPNGTTVLGGNAITSGSAKGNRLPTTPDWTANAGADYVVRLTRGSMHFSVNYYHSDGWRAEADNRLRQSPYDLINASATWFLDSRERYDLKLWGTNLTNKAYAIQMNAQAASDGVAFAPGRAFGITAGAEF